MRNRFRAAHTDLLGKRVLLCLLSCDGAAANKPGPAAKMPLMKTSAEQFAGICCYHTSFYPKQNRRISSILNSPPGAVTAPPTTP